jgi:hypothetical protein
LTILGTTEPVLQPLYARQGDEAHTVHTTTTAAATVEQTASSAVSKMNTFAGKESDSDAQRQETERIEHTADDSANSETDIAATTLASVPVSKSSATKWTGPSSLIIAKFLSANPNAYQLCAERLAKATNTTPNAREVEGKWRALILNHNSGLNSDGPLASVLQEYVESPRRQAWETHTYPLHDMMAEILEKHGPLSRALLHDHLADAYPNVIFNKRLLQQALLSKCFKRKQMKYTHVSP